MRPKSLRVASQTFSSWIPVNYLQTPFSLGYEASISEGASATYSVESGVTDPTNERAEVLITRSTTTATLKFPMDVSAAVGDMLYITGAGAPLDGWYAVASRTDSKTVTYTVDNSGAAASAPGAKALLVHVSALASGKTGDFAGNVTTPIQYIRLNITTYASGSVTLTVTQSN